MMNKLTAIIVTTLGIVFFSTDVYGQFITVYPGDVNNDGIVDNRDVVFLGIGFNQQGPQRDSLNQGIGADTVPAPPWNGQIVGNLNLAHADCNGDGLTNEDDLAAIDSNYGQTHGFPIIDSFFYGGPGDPQLYFSNAPDTLMEREVVTLTLNLGSNSIPVDSFFGISFSILYDSSVIVSQSMTAAVAPGFPSPVISPLFLQHDHSQGRLDVAMGLKAFSAGTGNAAIQVGGPFMTVSFIIEDNLFGISTQVPPLHIRFKDIKLIDAQNVETLIDTVPVEIQLKKLTSGIGDPKKLGIKVYPNPVQDKLIVWSPVDVDLLQLTDLTGKVIYSEENLNSGNTEIRVADMPKGLYLLRLKMADGILVKKIMVE